MLSDEVYDAFVLVPLYLGMYYKQDLHIHGLVSKRLYKNVMNYLQRILCDFSDDLSRIDVVVDGFGESHGEGNIIGTGISCGVDSLTTIYDRYVHEDDPEYRINGLFLFNCGTHGDFGEKSEKLYQARYEMNKSAAEELGLPVYQVESNLHAFTHKVGGDPQAGYFALWSCVLSLQSAVKKYYVSSAYSYNQILTVGKNAHDLDFSEFAESYTVPLVRTERLELILDGCQYERSMKTEHIADWDIAQKYLNVCVPQAHNCSKCVKCLRTLIVIEAMGKLGDFSRVFDIETYRKVLFKHKCDIMLRKNGDGFLTDQYTFARAHGMRFPSYVTAYAYMFPGRLYNLVKKVMRKFFGRH
ncbi:MAG: hypothetical protein IJS39_06825 [Synergistaceae bacterium]|nr:hypothetical protein [Synergistaceae bacterium]